jgi:hypothetical protein
MISVYPWADEILLPWNYLKDPRHRREDERDVIAEEHWRNLVGLLDLSSEPFAVGVG